MKHQAVGQERADLSYVGSSKLRRKSMASLLQAVFAQDAQEKPRLEGDCVAGRKSVRQVSPSRRCKSNQQKGRRGWGVVVVVVVVVAVAVVVVL